MQPSPKTSRSPAYHEGWLAALERQPLERNPYQPGDSRFGDWRSGWKEANDAKRAALVDRLGTQPAQGFGKVSRDELYDDN